MERKGLFITLEGLDGCGKSTQAKRLEEALTQQGYPVLLTREPGGTKLAEAIRNLILTPSREELHPLTEILLYTAARTQHVNFLIKPALKDGKIVICDRFVDSSIAYQGYGLGYDLHIIREINRMAVGAFLPDLTFLLDIDTEQGIHRIQSRSNAGRQAVDRIEARGAEFQAKVRRGFLDLAAQEPRMVLVPSSRRSIEEIHAEMLAIVMSKLHGE